MIRGVLLLLGAGAGFGSWTLADRARLHCGSYAVEHGAGLGRMTESLASVVAGAVLALAVHRAARFLAGGGTGTAARVVLPTLVVLVALALLLWGQFAWIGTPEGGVSDSGRCPASNVPRWWPGWLPA